MPLSKVTKVREQNTPNPDVCHYCRHKLRDVCVPCGSDGRYRFLEVRSDINHIELPRFRDIADLPTIERLAMIYICANVAQRVEKKS